MNNEPEAGMNLDPEMLAAYIDKRLSPEQRAAVEAQLANDPDSYAVLVETMKALDEVPEAQTNVPEVRTVPEVPKGRVPGARRWVIAGGVLAAAAALVLVVRLQPDLLQRFRSEPAMTRLVLAVGDSRPLEPRFTGGFQHAPVRVSRGGESAVQNLELLALVGTLEQAAQRNASVENLHALGVGLALIGRYDQAIVTLEQASAQSQELTVASDLAAAYLGRANATGDREDANRAFETTQRVLASGLEGRAEALFNRALAAEALGRTADAQRDWTELLTREPDSNWRREAQDRLQRLTGVRKP